MPVGNIKISATIISLNEEKNIGDCIKSLDWVDEVVVVDSLSTDRTCEIARELGAVVIDQKFLGHVKQKQLAVDKCSHDWVISLDADERVSEELKNSITELFEKTPEDQLVHGYTVARKNFHLGRWIMHGGWYPDRKVRVFNKQHGHWAGVDPHDGIVIEGEEGYLKGALEHYVFENLEHNIKTNNFYSSISARIFYEEGKKPSLTKLLFKPAGKFVETYLIKRGFMDGLPGFIIAMGAAYSIFLKYAKLWEHHLHQESQKKNS